MFRALTHKLPKPQYFLLCDDTRCGAHTHTEVDLSDQKLAAETQKNFIVGRKMEGWYIGLDSQLCPDHHRELVERNAAKQALVQPVNGNSSVDRMLKDEEQAKKLLIVKH